KESSKPPSVSARSAAALGSRKSAERASAFDHLGVQQALFADEIAQFLQNARLDLAGALARDTVAVADLLEGERLLGHQAGIEDLGVPPLQRRPEVHQVLVEDAA